MLPLTNDAIGDTVFSKAWVLSLLVRAVKAVQCGEKASGGPGMAVRDAEREERKPEGATVVGNDSEAKGRSHTCEASEEPVAIDDMEQQRERETEEDEGFGEVGAVERSGATGEDDSQEINESLENDLCRLWDASMNPVSNLSLTVYGAWCPFQPPTLFGHVAKKTIGGPGDKAITNISMKELPLKKSM